MDITAKIGRRLIENMGSVCYKKYIGQGQRVFLSLLKVFEVARV